MQVRSTGGTLDHPARVNWGIVMWSGSERRGSSRAAGESRAATRPRRSPARKGWSGSSSCAQVVHTRCGSFSWNLGGSITRSRQQASQKMKPHSRQWCRSRVNGLHTAVNLVTHDTCASSLACN